MNHFFDSESITSYLTQCVYNLLVQETENITLTFSHPMHALKSIKQIGANYVSHRIHKGLSAKSPFAKMDTNELTYVIGYFIARKS